MTGKFVATLVLVCAASAQPRLGTSNIEIPVPPDPHELVTGNVRVPSATERGPALEMLQAALQNSRLQYSGMGPYRIDATLTSATEGSGQFTQTWLSPQTWRWSATFGGTTVVRGSSSQGAYAESESAVPMRVHELRNAIFSSMWDVAIGTQLRMAPVNVEGKPATCLLTSGVVGPAKYSGRLWEELEYCFDDATKLLVSASFAPGVFTVYRYDTQQAVHGHTIPDHLTMYVGGAQIIDATVKVADASAVAPSTLDPGGPRTRRSSVLEAPIRRPLPILGTGAVTRVTPVLIHANVVEGAVRETEICATTDPQMASAARAAVQDMRFAPGIQQQVYFTVKFMPAADGLSNRTRPLGRN